MKRAYRLLLLYLIVIVSFCNIEGFAADIEKEIPISLSVNGNYILMDSQPFIEKDSVFVPIRFVGQALGVQEIVWDNENKRVVIKDKDKIIEMFINSNEALINGETYVLNAPPVAIDNRTMVPLRFVAENLDCEVVWNDQTYTVEISKEGVTVPAINILNRTYSDEDIYWLSKIVQVEARDLSFDGKLAVANVVINRKNSYEFPNTIYDVIYDKNYCVQFPPAYKSSFISTQPSSDSIIAAKMALEGNNNISKCLYFNNVPFKSKSNDLFKKIDGEYFYY